MARDDLRKASKQLSRASEAATDGETTDRLEQLAEDVDRMVTAERGPDHGRLARLQHDLDAAKADAGADASEAIDRALTHVVSYRETVEGI